MNYRIIATVGIIQDGVNKEEYTAIKQKPIIPLHIISISSSKWQKFPLGSHNCYSTSHICNEYS